MAEHIRPTMVIRGTAGGAQRRPIGGTIIDHWTWIPDTPDGNTVPTSRMLAVALGPTRELWIVPARFEVHATPSDRSLIVSLPRDDDVCREVCRHLARQVANGIITMPPRTATDIAIWQAAVGISLSFIERYGTLSDLEHERPQWRKRGDQTR